MNKNHFANYLVMTLPVTLAVLFLLGDRSTLPRAGSWRGKLLWFASREATWVLVFLGMFAVQLLAFLRTASRGGFLGLMASLVCFGVLLVLNRQKRVAPIVFTGVVVLVVLVVLFQAQMLVNKLKLIQESPMADTALWFRLSNWKDTVRIFLDFPLIGIGTGAFHELFPLYKTMPEKSVFSQVRFHHAENEFLESLAELGALGTGILLSFGLVLAFAFLRQWRKTQSKTVQWISLGMVSGCAGMIAHSLVDFTMHVPANMALCSVFGGVLARVAYGEVLSGDAQTIFRRKSSGTFSGFIWAAGISIAVFFYFAPLLYRQWLSESYYLAAKRELGRITKDRTVSLSAVLTSYDALLNARKWGPEQARIHHGLGLTYTYFGILTESSLPKRRAWFNQAEDAFRKAIKISALNADYHYALGWLYEEWGKPDQAKSYLERAALLEPQNAFYLFRYGRNALHLKEMDLALAAFRKTLRINRAYLEPVLDIVPKESAPDLIDYWRRLPPESSH